MFKEQHIMQRSKEIQGQMRNKIVDMYQSGKSYKLVMQSLIYFGEPVLFEQFGSLNRFKKADSLAPDVIKQWCHYAFIF